jgi:hypothetical protein
MPDNKTRRPVKELVSRTILNSKGNVFFTENFSDFGDKMSIVVAIRQLMRDGLLAELGPGIYVSTDKRKYADTPFEKQVH